MTARGKAPWDSLSPEMKHAVAALVVAWHSCRARRIKVGLPTSSPEVFDDEDDTTMETVSYDTAPAPPPPVHADFTMEQVQTHYNATMAEEQPASAPLLAFQQA